MKWVDFVKLLRITATLLWGGPRGRLISQLDVPEKFRKLVVDFGGLSFVLTLTDTVFRPTHPFRMKVLYLQKPVKKSENSILVFLGRIYSLQ